MNDRTLLGAAEGARLAVDVASEKQATDIVMLDMRGPFGFTDYFVILTAESHRQMQVLIEDIDQALDKAQMKIHHREGTTDGGWVLMDYGNLVVHVFAPEEREYYNLEHLWPQATVLFRIQ
ncbi:ribosome silencing factor [SAR202 cluster bacterium AC-647-N09_OGT_505m]|nr:ribosome silencing factor [SAR202 cluster bacterium AC-647-N09_OGT_505m]